MVPILAAFILIIDYRRINRLPFWRMGVVAIFVQQVVGILGEAGGTLDDPRGDGILTHLIRQASNDGGAVALWALVVFALAWGVPFWLLFRGAKASRENPR